MRKTSRQLIVWTLILCLCVTTVLTGIPDQLVSHTPREVSAASYPKLKTINYEPTGNQRKDMVGYARTQIGYKEKGNNNTYFGSWYGLNYNPWCAMFVSWCAAKAGVSTSVLPRGASADRGWAKKKKVYYKSKAFGGSYTPKAGDLIYFSWSGKDWADHIGIVSGTGKVNGTKYVYTIEGNKHDKVVEGSYKLSNKYILGYASPKYTSTVPENGYLLKYRKSLGGKDRATAIGIFEKNLILAGRILTKTGKTYSAWQVYRFDENGEVIFLCRDIESGRTEQWCPSNAIPEGFQKVTVKIGKPLQILTQVEGTIYACPIWTVKTYKIKYEPRGGLHAPQTQIKVYNKKIRLSKDKPDKTGYKFKGWAVKKGSKKVSYKPGAKYKKNKKLTLYAVWKPIKTPFKVRVIKPDGLNVRAKASLKAKIIKVVPKGTTLEIVKLKKGWGKISGKNQWVMLKFTVKK